MSNLIGSVTDVLVAIANWVKLAFEFVFNVFYDIIYLIKLTGVFLARIPEYFSWLPAEIVSLLILIFTIVVLYKVLGREG